LDWASDQTVVGSNPAGGALNVGINANKMTISPIYGAINFC
jgi:hypothetical protein